MGDFDFKYMSENFITGFTDEMGPAWWHEWGDITTVGGATYAGAIPMSRVREFFSWEPVKVALMREGEIGEAIPLKDFKGKGRVAIVHSDTGHLLGVHSEGYPRTGYTERLVEGLEAILDDTLEAKVGSMGVLYGGQQAWIQIRTPKVVTHHTGEKFFPWVSAYSSLDGSLANTFKEGTTRIVCDNTFDMFRGEDTATYKYRNTSQNELNVATARSVLDLLEATTERYSATIDHLLDAVLSPEAFDKTIKIVIPTKDEERVSTQTQNRRNAIAEIYHHDNRVGPFIGTKWAGLQAFSTWFQHEQTLASKEDVRAERNMARLATGEQAKFDQKVLKALALV